MTPEDAIAEYHRVIAEYDRIHRPDPLEQRRQQREAEKQERRQQEVRKIEDQAIHRVEWDTWFEQRFAAALMNPDLLRSAGFIDVLGMAQAETCKKLRREYETKFAAQEARIKQLEAQLSLEAKFFEMEHRLNARQLARDEAKRGLEMIPQSELPAKIDALQRQVDELESVADLDERFRELTERVGALEQTTSLEARLAELAHEAERRSEHPQSGLLPRIDRLERQIDDLTRVADLDARFCELIERVGALEKTADLEARFTKLANEAKGGSVIQHGELLDRIEALQRHIDELKSIADLDACFRELAERVGKLENTNSLEARFAELAHEVKRGSELPQNELLARIDGLQRQFDDLKRVPGQPGPQGPPGRPGKLPSVKDYVGGRVHYEADVVVHAGALWQARTDTVHAPPHDDWVCLARAGRDGMTPTVRGTYDVHEVYQRLDIVALDGAAFIAKKNAPGICPGSGWQMISRQGRQGKRGESITGPPGEKGERGEKGEKGAPALSIHSWQLDPERYRVSPLWSDGEVGPTLELRRLFEHFMYDIGGLDERH